MTQHYVKTSFGRHSPHVFLHNLGVTQQVFLVMRDNTHISILKLIIFFENISSGYNENCCVMFIQTGSSGREAEP